MMIKNNLVYVSDDEIELLSKRIFRNPNMIKAYHEIGDYRLFDDDISDKTIKRIIKNLSYNVPLDKIITKDNITHMAFGVLWSLVGPGYGNRFFRYYYTDYENIFNKSWFFIEEDYLRTTPPNSSGGTGMGCFKTRQFFLSSEALKVTYDVCNNDKVISLEELYRVLIDGAISVVPVGYLREDLKYHIVYPHNLSRLIEWYDEIMGDTVYSVKGHLF